MSGVIVVPTDNKETILWHTLDECQAKSCAELTAISPGMYRGSVTAIGRIDNEKFSS